MIFLKLFTITGLLDFAGQPPQHPYKVAKNCVFVGITDFFASLMGCGWGWYDCIRRIPEEPQ